MNAIISPCIRQCTLDDNDICLGCFRSLHEITRWTQVDDKTRQDFLRNAESRKKARDKIRHITLELIASKKYNAGDN